jgi:hypothetical protein
VPQQNEGRKHRGRYQERCSGFFASLREGVLPLFDLSASERKPLVCAGRHRRAPGQFLMQKADGASARDPDGCFVLPVASQLRSSASPLLSRRKAAEVAVLLVIFFKGQAQIRPRQSILMLIVTWRTWRHRAFDLDHHARAPSKAGSFYCFFKSGNVPLLCRTNFFRVGRIFRSRAQRLAALKPSGPRRDSALHLCRGQ